MMLARLYTLEGGGMHQTFFPIIYSAAPAVEQKIGPELHLGVLLALKAILKSHRTFEVAYQQIQFRGHNLAFCSRISSRGDLIIELDVGDESLTGRIILEEELRTAEHKARKRRGRA
jgi:hypothetical protein